MAYVDIGDSKLRWWIRSAFQLIRTQRSLLTLFEFIFFMEFIGLSFFLISLFLINVFIRNSQTSLCAYGLYYCSAFNIHCEPLLISGGKNSEWENGNSQLGDAFIFLKICKFRFPNHWLEFLTSAAISCQTMETSCATKPQEPMVKTS